MTAPISIADVIIAMSNFSRVDYVLSEVDITCSGSGNSFLQLSAIINWVKLNLAVVSHAMGCCAYS